MDGAKSMSFQTGMIEFFGVIVWLVIFKAFKGNLSEDL